MQKEQIFVLVCAGVAGLVIWSNLGQYEAVGVDGPWNGKDLDVAENVSYDVLYGLKAPAAEDRPLNKEHRVEERPPLPDLPAPSPRGVQWTLPIPSPGPDPAHWGGLKAPLTKQDGTAVREVAVEEAPEIEDPFAKKTNFMPEKAQRLVWADGREEICYLRMPNGEDIWVILERWPNVDFEVRFLNKNGSVRAVAAFGPNGTSLERVKTVHLGETLLYEFHEERIRSGVTDTDQAKLVEFGNWVADTLGDKYGVAAVRMAIPVFEKAYALGADLALVLRMGQVYRKAYDLEGELALYQRFQQAKPQNAKAKALVAGALYQRGALGVSAEIYEEAATSGDADILLGLAECLYRQGELDKARAHFEKVKNAGDALQRSHALEGLARIALRRGQFSEAASLANSAVSAASASARANNTLGSVLYCQGKFREAEEAFTKAANVWGDEDTRALSNRGFARLAQGNTAEAVADFYTCVDTDPLNYIDPIVGLSVAHQVYGELVESNDALDLVLTRDPKNAYALLRRAQTRMRDGAPKDGVEMGKKALAVAPSSVDALQVVGLAAGAAEDHATAADYLARAARKRPRDLNLTFDHCRALIMNGRVNQSAQILAEVTNTNGGAGSQDPRLLSLAAYALFLGKGDVPEVLRRIQSALIKQPSKEEQAWLEAARDAIVEWNNSRIWTDSFNRQAGAKVLNQWTEVETPGPKIQLSGTSVKVAGAINREGGIERQATALLRNEELKKFVSAETAVKVSRGDEMLFHLYVGELPERVLENEDSSGRRSRLRGGELGIGVLRDGTMVVFASLGRDRKKPQEEIRLKDAEGKDRKWPIDDQFHTIRIVRTDDRKGVFSIFLDEEEIVAEDLQNFEVGPLSQAAKQCRVGFLIDGDVGHTVNTEIDYVQIRRKLQ